MGTGSEGYEIRIVSHWDPDEIVDLYREGGWWKEGYDPSGIQDLIEGSYLFAVAVPKEGGKAVGMGRMISDGTSDGYIQDVVVRSDHRERGIGGRIVAELARRASGAGLVWIGLIAQKGTVDFYEELGFTTFEGTPMLYDGGE